MRKSRRRVSAKPKAAARRRLPRPKSDSGPADALDAPPPQQAAGEKSAPLKNFAGVIRGSSRPVQSIAKALRKLVCEELPDVAERYYAGRRPMAMYRTIADVCWIQPQLRHCNIYFMRGAELADPKKILEGMSERFKHAKVRTLDDLEALPLRAWLRATAALNAATLRGGLNFEQVLRKLRTICLALPDTKETLTWGIPHFRVGEKIFCGCAEDRGRPRIGLKMERYHSEVMMKLPGIEKAPYSRPGDGWVTIDPGVFDDWEELESLLVGSFRLIAPKRTLALLDLRPRATKPPRKSARRPP